MCVFTATVPSLQTSSEESPDTFPVFGLTIRTRMKSLVTLGIAQAGARVPHRLCALEGLDGSGRRACNAVFASAYVRLGSKARITALQQQWPVHLSQQTLEVGRRA